MRCPLCQAKNPPDAHFCVVCGERLPHRVPATIARAKAKPELPIALAFLAAGEFFAKIQSMSTGISLWDMLIGLVPAAVYAALFLVSPLQDWFVDPWLLRVAAIAIGGLVLFGNFLYVFG